MSNEEAQKILDSMHSVNPENLEDEAKKLFEAVMKIADERDELRKTVVRQSLKITAQKELIDYLRKSCDRKESNWIEEQQENVELETKLEEKEQIINAMAEYIEKKQILVDKYYNVLTAEAIKQWFEKQIK